MRVDLSCIPARMRNRDTIIEILGEHELLNMRFSQEHLHAADKACCLFAMPSGLMSGFPTAIYSECVLGRDDFPDEASWESAHESAHAEQGDEGFITLLGWLGFHLDTPLVITAHHREDMRVAAKVWTVFPRSTTVRIFGTSDTAVSGSPYEGRSG